MAMKTFCNQCSMLRKGGLVFRKSEFNCCRGRLYLLFGGGLRLPRLAARTIMAGSTAVRPLVFSGPSGSGKSTLVKRLMGEYTDCFAFSISHTTRQPRPGEKHGKDYYFVTREEMKKAIDNNEFIEHAEFSGNLYGTSKKSVEEVMSSGRICILDIDMQGVQNIKKTDLNPKYIFIKPPSLKTLEERLRGRGTESEESLAKRLAACKAEMEYAEQKGSYDHIIVNDDLDKAYALLKDIVGKDADAMKKNRNQASK